MYGHKYTNTNKLIVRKENTLEISFHILFLLYFKSLKSKLRSFEGKSIPFNSTTI